MVRDGHRDGLVGAYGLDGLRVGSEPIGWVGLAFYTRHDSDWHYSAMLPCSASAWASPRAT